MAYQFTTKIEGHTVRLLISMVAALSLSVCASRTALAESTQPKAKPIASFDLLTVINENGEISAESPEYVAQYSDGTNKAPVYQPAPAYVQGGSGAGIGAGIVVAGVAMIVANQMQKRKDDLDLAISSIGFRPAYLLNKALKPLLEEKGIKLESTITPDQAKQVRADYDFSRVATKAEAILDVRVTDHGYFRSMRAGGLSPMLGITVTLIEPITGETIDSFTYWSDWRKVPDDPRWFTSPPALTYESTDSLRANASAARAGLEEILAQMTVRMVEDIQRRSQGIVEEK